MYVPRTSSVNDRSSLLPSPLALKINFARPVTKVIDGRDDPDIPADPRTDEIHSRIIRWSHALHRRIVAFGGDM